MTINDKVQATTAGEKLQAAVDQAGELYQAGGNVFWRGTQRGQLDGSGLHHAAQILQVPDEFWGSNLQRPARQ